MCWRGHDRRRRNKYGACLDCHAIRMRAYRRGREPRRLIKYALDLDLFYEAAEGRIKKVCHLAHIPYNTLACWLYGCRHRGIKCRTTRPYAEALAKTLKLPIEKLWEEMK